MATKTQLLNYITMSTRDIKKKNLLYDNSKNIIGIVVNKRKKIWIEDIEKYSIKLAKVSIMRNTDYYFIISLIMKDSANEYSICVRPNAMKKLVRFLPEKMQVQQERNIKRIDFENTKNQIKYFQITYEGNSVQEKISNLPVHSSNRLLFRDKHIYGPLIIPLLFTMFMSFIFIERGNQVPKKAVIIGFITILLLEIMLILLSMGFSINSYSQPFKIIFKKKVVVLDNYIFWFIVFILNLMLLLIMLKTSNFFEILKQ